MKASWLHVKKRIEAMSRRERLSIFVVAVIAIVMGSDFFVISPLLMKSKTANLKHFNLEIEEKNLQKDLSQIEIDKNGIELKERFRSRTIEYDSVIKPLIANAKRQLLSPDNVSSFITGLIPQNDGVKLTSLRSLHNKDQNNSQGLYRHPFAVEFEGRYVDLVAQINHIESSQWKLMIDSMSIEADEKTRPNSILKLSLVAFSDSPNWLSDANLKANQAPKEELGGRK